MHHVVVFEATHYVGDGVHFTNVRKELVAEAFALRSALHDARDVHELDGGGEDAFRLHDGRERIEARVRHGHHAHVRVNGAERVVFRRNLGARQRIEEGRLADIREADDSALDAHDGSFVSCFFNWPASRRTGGDGSSPSPRLRCTP